MITELPPAAVAGTVAALGAAGVFAQAAPHDFGGWVVSLGPFAAAGYVLWVAFGYIRERDKDIKDTIARVEIQAAADRAATETMTRENREAVDRLARENRAAAATAAQQNQAALEKLTAELKDALTAVTTPLAAAIRDIERSVELVLGSAKGDHRPPRPRPAGGPG